MVYHILTTAVRQWSKSSFKIQNWLVLFHSHDYFNHKKNLPAILKNISCFQTQSRYCYIYEQAPKEVTLGLTCR